MLIQTFSENIVSLGQNKKKNHVSKELQFTECGQFGESGNT